jgi:sugar phosphate isomerase/epimerase
MVLNWGYNTNGFAHHRLEDALVILADLGYRSVAVTLDHHALNPFDPDLPKQLATVKELLRKLKLRSVIETGARFLLDPWQKHQPTLLDPTALAGFQKRLKFLKRAVDIAHELRSDVVSFWSGTPLQIIRRKIYWIRLVEGCEKLCSYAKRKKVRLAFEPEPGMFIDTMRQFTALRKRVDHPLLGLTLDIGHLHCQGETPITRHLKRWQDILWNIHIEDMRRGVHEHLMFGEGEINFGPVLAMLKKIGYEGGLHVELSRHSHDAINVARRALEFLQSV